MILKVFVIILAATANFVLSQNVTDTSLPAPSNDDPIPKPPNEDFPSRPSAPHVPHPYDPYHHKKVLLGALGNVFHNLKPTTFLRPAKESFLEFLALLHQPNCGGINMLSPQQLWEKIQEIKGQGGPGDAVRPIHEYPFRYRQVEK